MAIFAVEKEPTWVRLYEFNADTGEWCWGYANGSSRYPFHGPTGNLSVLLVEFYEAEGMMKFRQGDE